MAANKLKIRGRCIAPGCKSIKIVGGKHFFTFPHEPMRCWKWIRFCGLEDRYRVASEVKQGLKICMDHFTESDYYRSAHTVRLKHTAVPTLHANGIVMPFNPKIQSPPPSPAVPRVTLSPETTLTFRHDKNLRTYARRAKIGSAAPVGMPSLIGLQAANEQAAGLAAMPQTIPSPMGTAASNISAATTYAGTNKDACQQDVMNMFKVKEELDPLAAKNEVNADNGESLLTGRNFLEMDINKIKMESSDLNEDNLLGVECGENYFSILRTLKSEVEVLMKYTPTHTHTHADVECSCAKSTGLDHAATTGINIVLALSVISSVYVNSIFILQEESHILLSVKEEPVEEEMTEDEYLNRSLLPQPFDTPDALDRPPWISQRTVFGDPAKEPSPLPTGGVAYTSDRWPDGTVVMDVIKTEPETDPLALQNECIKEEKKPLSLVRHPLEVSVDHIKVEVSDPNTDHVSDIKHEDNEFPLPLEVSEFEVELSSFEYIDFSWEESWAIDKVKAEFKVDVTEVDDNFERPIQLHCQEEVGSQEVDISENSTQNTSTVIHAQRSTNNFVNGESRDDPSFQKSFNCEICGKGFMTMKRLKQHRQIHTGQKPFKCDTCGKSFARLGHLQRHVSIHASDKPFKCTVCEKGFTRPDLLRRHVTTHESTHAGLRPYKCEVCDKSFTERCHLKQHGLIHTGDKAFKCNICTKAFRSSANLKLHMVIHSEEKLLKCDLCGKKFTTSDDAARHMSIHNDKNAYKCDICSKNFWRKSRLQYHLLKHMEEKPYSCNVCCRGYRQASSLKEHVRVHTGEKPFKCTVCDKTFRLSTQLKEHLRTSESESLKCGMCEREFSNSKCLKYHMIIHTGETPFPCTKCEMSFKSNRSRMLHMSSHKIGNSFQCNISGNECQSSDHNSFQGNISGSECQSSDQNSFECNISGKECQSSDHDCLHTTH
ncbi:hypothetical protein ANN_00201 [Periplaneta americana]|uniref:Uncharacterized protein n=1 Tax=Periplaneta americana TaxID=6978 RepID=A0ABQ8TQ70_PERAM|nr:hypothetical protein ANN_00201 [Periplaneta americana]